MRCLNRLRFAAALLAAILLATPGAVALLDADAIGQVTGDPADVNEQQPPLPEEVEDAVRDLTTGPVGGGNPDDGAGIGDIGKDVAASLGENWLLTGAIALGVVGAGAAVFVLASRYVDPTEALRNPQRSMLYGFVKGNPGVHLKMLSSEFGMKTSTVLWHIRKLEHADLVRSRKANGYRVFYPVSGGLEARQLSTAITALSNDNARRIFESVALKPGVVQRHLSEQLSINPGTVRWHAKKLRDAGLVAELVKDRAAFYYATDLGIKAMRQVVGLPPDVKAPTIDVSDVSEDVIPAAS